MLPSGPEVLETFTQRTSQARKEQSVSSCTASIPSCVTLESSLPSTSSSNMSAVEPTWHPVPIRSRSTANYWAEPQMPVTRPRRSMRMGLLSGSGASTVGASSTSSREAVLEQDAAAVAPGGELESAVVLPSQGVEVQEELAVLPGGVEVANAPPLAFVEIPEGEEIRGCPANCPYNHDHDRHGSRPTRVENLRRKGHATLCWACEKAVHPASTCPNPGGWLYCHLCGWKHYTIRTCPQCGKHHARDQYWRR